MSLSMQEIVSCYYSSTIRFSRLSESSEVWINFEDQIPPMRLLIFDMAGNLIKNFKDIRCQSIPWNIADTASGTYFIQAVFPQKICNSSFFLAN